MIPEFRAWYTPFKHSNFGQTMKYGKAGTILNFAEMNPDKYVVEQYTGLKDVNGNKIFEGDILKSSQGHTRPFYYLVKWSKRHAAFVVDYLFLGGVSGEDLKPYEVAGNIHENPELLGVDK